MALATNDQPAAFAAYVANVEHAGHTAPASRRVRLPRSIIVIAVLLASAVTGYVWLHERLDSAPPAVRPIDPYTALFDFTPVTVTVTAGDQQLEWHTSIHEVRTDWTLWRRMHLADWNSVPETLRQEGLDNMLATYRRILMSPSAWDEMGPTDWDLVPQPVREAPAHAVHSQSGFTASVGLHVEESASNRAAGLAVDADIPILGAGVSIGNVEPFQFEISLCASRERLEVFEVELLAQTLPWAWVEATWLSQSGVCSSDTMTWWLGRPSDSGCAASSAGAKRQGGS
jgi:hypothetical protein